MPLVGGGGAGNVSGGNPSGTGTSINYVGNHAYAYSGVIEVSNSLVTLLDFSVGNSYIMAKFQPFYNDADQGDNVAFEIKVDSELIYSIELAGATTANTHRGDPNPIPILIPPYGRITVQGKNSTDSDTRNIGIVITGRVYE